MNKKLIIASTFVLVIVAFFTGKYFYKKSDSDTTQKLAKTDENVFVRPHSPTLGKENAKVTIVEFLDPECESCRGFYPYVKSIYRANQENVRLVVRYVPFHKNSKFAIAILEASKLQGKFWQTLEVLFENQPEWGNHHHPNPEKIWDYLPALGLDIELLKKDISNPNIQTTIEQDLSDSQKLSIRGTPTFFVNGRRLTNFGPQGLQALVEEELSK